MARSIWQLFDIVKSAIVYNDVESLQEIFIKRSYTASSLSSQVFDRGALVCLQTAHNAALVGTLEPKHLFREKAKRNCVTIR